MLPYTQENTNLVGYKIFTTLQIVQLYAAYKGMLSEDEGGVKYKRLSNFLVLGHPHTYIELKFTKSSC